MLNEVVIKKLLLMLLLSAAAVLPGSVKAQNARDIKDTIRVVALQDFRVPDDRLIVLTNIFKADFSAELLNSSFSRIRDLKNFIQVPSRQEFAKAAGGGRGATVQFSLTDMIDTPGEYYIKINIRSQSEVSQKDISVYYMIKAGLPTIVSDVQLKPSYFFNEKESFSFYTREYNDFNSYSYRIEREDGSLIERGKGALVSLNNVLKSIENVGKKIRITGEYRGKVFRYRLQDGREAESAWQITIRKPELEEFSDWQKTGEKQQNAISAYDLNAMRILYTYMGNTENGFVVVTPEIKNFQLKAEPEGFISNTAYRKSGNFVYVTFKINDDYLATMEKCSEEKLKLTVRFTTQFGEKVERNYEAFIQK